MAEPPLSLRRTAREDDWLGALVREYSGPLHGYFLRRTGSQSDAEDLVQEVFARLAQMADASKMENPQAYVFQIAVNLLRDRARRSGARRSAMHEPFDEAMHAETGGSPEARLLAREELAQVERTLGALPRKTKIVFLLHRLDGLKYREIADAMGLSVSTVEKHMMKALSAIGRGMERV